LAIYLISNFKLNFEEEKSFYIFIGDMLERVY